MCNWCTYKHCYMYVTYCVRNRWHSASDTELPDWVHLSPTVVRLWNNDMLVHVCVGLLSRNGRFSAVLMIIKWVIRSVHSGFFLHLVKMASNFSGCFRVGLWVIPPGWGMICDGVNCYIHKCTIYYPWL